MSPLLRLYLAASHLAGPIWRVAHRKRLSQGKEIAARLPEKYGVAPAPRPEGEVLWFHALSVGESLALLPLIERALADRPTATVALTTSTATSAEALSKAGLPKRACHVFLPIDTPRAVRRFLDHWQPALAAFAELDFWPRLMVETARRNIPMVLVNSRMPEGNFERRRKLGGMMRDILRLFDRLLVQDAESAERFAELGADPKRISVTGPLKAVARPLPADAEQMVRVTAAIGPRPVWLAAATHASEHDAIIAAHRLVRAALPGALLLLAPRHVSDGPEAARAAVEAGFEAALRSDGGALDTDVYVADTIGEMGLWYRASPVSFVGHSLGWTDLEGKNPFEAVALGSAVLYGPNYSYFSESYEALSKSGGAALVATSDDLARAVIALINANDKRKTMVDAANGVVTAKQAVLENSWVLISRCLN